MAGTISSLGIGSGVLTADVIDQLREADEAQVVTPLDNKISLEEQKATAFELLQSLMTTFKSSVSALSYDTLYENRTVDVTGGDLEVSAEAGTAVSSFTLETIALATKNVQQSGEFSSRTASVADGSGTMTVSIGGQDYEIGYTASTTLEELAQAINDEAGDSVTASILQTGENAFSLILTSNDTGADQTITISDTPDVAGSGLVDALYDDTTATSGFTSVQDANDASFKYNGITISRSSNEISDLISGVTLTLKTEGETASVNITQDVDAVVTEMQLFVENYNNLITNLEDMISYDSETGAQGVFNGDSFIKSISRSITDVITSMNSDRESLVNFGIDIDKYGVMSFDESAFRSKFNDDPAAAESFLAGGYEAETYEPVNGIFDTLNDTLNEYTKYSGLFDNFQTNLDTRSEALAAQRERVIAMLDTRYEIMTKRFTAYDALISKLETQFASLQQMIDSESNN